MVLTCWSIWKVRTLEDQNSLDFLPVKRISGGQMEGSVSLSGWFQFLASQYKKLPTISLKRSKCITQSRKS